MIIIKHEQTNSVNDSTVVLWYKAKDDSDAYDWLSERNDEVDKWNHATPGAVSYRYGYATWYREHNLKELTLDALPGIPLTMLAEILFYLKATA